MKPFEGDPIKPALDRLMDQIKPQEGEVYQHPDIAHVAGCEYPSARYNGIVQSWKKRLLRELNVDIEAVVCIGYRVLTDNERVGVGIHDFSRSVRHMGKSAERIARADAKKLDDNHRKQQDHAVRLTQELVNSGRKASRQIGVAGRIVSLPRPKQAQSA